MQQKPEEALFEEISNNLNSNVNEIYGELNRFKVNEGTVKGQMDKNAEKIKKTTKLVEKLTQELFKQNENVQNLMT